MWQFRFTVVRDQTAPLIESLQEKVITLSFFEDEENPIVWTIQGLCQDQNAAKDVADYLEAHDASTDAFVMEALPEKDWLAENRAAFPAIEVGRFYIHGSHMDGPSDPSKTVFEIDASLAFGTGQHETTKGCLLALEELSENKNISNALDLGCGSAILAMGVASLWEEAQVLATDIDADALEVAKRNVSQNGFEKTIHCEVSNGFDHPTFKENGPFDLIVANILAEPLISLSAELVQQLQPGGTVILSGLLNTQAEDVIAAYEQQGLTLQQHNTFGDWSVLVLGK